MTEEKAPTAVTQLIVVAWNKNKHEKTFIIFYTLTIPKFWFLLGTGTENEPLIMELLQILEKCEHILVKKCV